MPSSTTRRALPYPTLSDPADVPHDMQALAEALEGGVEFLSGPIGSRPAATTKGGRFYIVTSGSDQGDIYLERNTAWFRIYQAKPVWHDLTLNTGWTLFDGSLPIQYSDPAPDNKVYLHGLALWTASGSPNVHTSNAGPLITLPAGKRPARQCTFQVGCGISAGSVYGTAMVEVLTDGGVHLRESMLYRDSAVVGVPSTGVPNWTNFFLWLNHINFHTA